MSTSAEVKMIVGDLMDKARKRNALMRAINRLDLQMQAYARGFEERGKELGLSKTELETFVEAKCIDIHGPLSLAIEPIKGPRRAYEKQIIALAMQLPVWPWVQAIPGFGPLGLGLVIAEIGDLGNYPNPAKVWKRMGVAVIDGRAQRRVRDTEEGIRQGFSPRRRSLLYVIGDALIKQNKNEDGSDGEYRSLYLSRKAYEVEKDPGQTKIVYHFRASRYMQKRLLRELWRAWQTFAFVSPNPPMSALA